jgi:hypothetical protein
MVQFDLANDLVLSLFHFGETVTRLFMDSSSLGRYVFGSEILYNKAPPRLPGLGC